MSKARKQKTIFAVWDGETELYVELKYSGIHPLVAAIDGLTLRIEKGPRGKIGKTYITAIAAADWHRKELQETNGRSGNKKALDALVAALAKHASGKSRMQ